MKTTNYGFARGVVLPVAFSTNDFSEVRIELGTGKTSRHFRPSSGSRPNIQIGNPTWEVWTKKVVRRALTQDERNLSPTEKFNRRFQGQNFSQQ